jgi:predicted permease
MTRLLFSFGIIIFGITLGYAVQRLDGNGMIKLPLSTVDLRKFLQKCAIIYLSPIAIAGAIWIVKIESARLIALPFISVGAFVSGGFLALAAARLLKLPPQKTGSLFSCGSFSNTGGIGMLVCFVFLGESGFAFVPIFRLFEEMYIYGVGFPAIRSFNRDVPDTGTSKKMISLFKDPFVLSVLMGILTGFIMNISGIRRPEFFSLVNSILVPFMTFIMLVSIGLSLRFSRVKNYIRESVCISAIKFVLVPVLMTSVALSLGFQKIDNGLPLKVVIILSSMPVAFNALIPPSIYDLDVDLANSCWFVTTAMLAIVLPVLLLIVSAF